MSEFIYSETPIQAKVHSSQRATPDELVTLAKKIWRDVKKSGVAADDEGGNEELLKRLQDKYKDFMLSFPLVLRWMVQRREFNANAFRKYLIKHATLNPQDRKAYFTLQAEYLVLLYAETHPHYDQSYLPRYRDEIIKHLQKEDDEFTALQKEVEVEMETHTAVNDHDRRRTLMSYIMRQRVAAETAKTTVATATAAVATTETAAAIATETAAEAATTIETATETAAVVTTETAAMATTETAAVATPQ